MVKKIPLSRVALKLFVLEVYPYLSQIWAMRKSRISIVNIENFVQNLGKLNPKFGETSILRIINDYLVWQKLPELLPNICLENFFRY